MKTQKLYEEDAYLSEFDAKVLSCESAGKGCKIILDRTAFFPEGGGQPSDVGIVAGVKVFDVQIENGEIFHYTEKPLNIGQTVSCNIDFSRRYNFMQNHTAEHIVSGIVHEKFGFDNIGFHLNENEVTFDFNGFFTSEELKETEFEANRRVWQNLSVNAFYPTDKELKRISYRFKDGIEGQIRLVEIENTDVCACCAPHVKSTGEIGIIKFLSTEKQHGGTRIFMKCGRFALDDYENKNTDIKAICEVLSAKTENVCEAVCSLNSRLETEKIKVKSLNTKMLEYRVKLFDKSKQAIMLDSADNKDLQMTADGLHKAYGGVRTALAKSKDGCAFVMCGDEEKIGGEFKKLNSVFTVKGGGRGNLRQGSILAPAEKIKEYFGV